MTKEQILAMTPEEHVDAAIKFAETTTPEAEEIEKTTASEIRKKLRSAMYLAECHELQYQAVEPVVFEILHHQLQKARQDWLREEIVRLQDQQGRWVAGYAPATNGIDPSKWGFRTEKQAWDYIKKTHLCEPNCEACEAEWMVYTEPNTDQALQTIIDRYQAELDQDKALQDNK